MLIYDVVINLYGFVIRMASIRKTKAKQWIAGRKNWREIYDSKLKSFTGQKKIWVHCASYGEFEQGRPLIDAIRKKYPGYRIVLTFFSPSGYEAFKSWNGAEVILYLPLDTKSNARDFIKMVDPAAVIFIKYEFWLNYLFQLKKLNIPTYLVSAVFKAHHPFFKWYGAIFRKSLSTFSKLFVQDKTSGKLLELIHVKNYEISGDTRFDRVLEVKNSHRPMDFFVKYCAGSQIIVAGSTWPEDEAMLLSAFEKLKEGRIRLILVPHEVDEKSVSNLAAQLEALGYSYAKYSDGEPDISKQVLIVDAMGLLSKIYYYADAAYIGGGFSGGIHNVLEAAVYGVPVTFYGKDYIKHNEAVDLKRLGAAIQVMSSDELYEALNLILNDHEFRKTISEKLAAFFEERGNTSEKILNLVQL
jgi:3-deoxy-D-manno-octulosonic-acid transferase